MTQLTPDTFAVEAPEYVTDFKSFFKCVKNDEIEVPEGESKFLLATMYATEEQARLIVGSSEWFFPARHTRYVDYAHPYDTNYKQAWGIGFSKALDSLKSLLAAKGLDESKNYVVVKKQNK